MADQDRPEDTGEARDRREQRIMWIFSGCIVLVILIAMGANMMFHRDTSTASENTDISAQSRTAPQQ